MEVCESEQSKVGKEDLVFLLMSNVMCKSCQLRLSLGIFYYSYISHGTNTGKYIDSTRYHSCHLEYTFEESEET